MGPLFHLVRPVADVGSRVISPLLVALYHILANREGGWKRGDLLEIWAVVGENYFQGLVVNSFDSQSIRISGSVRHPGIALNHINHVAVICRCLWVGQTLPAVLKVFGSHFLAVRPLDPVTHLKGIGYGAVIIDHLFPGLCLAWSQGRVALAVVNPLDQAFENMVDGDGTVNRAV